MFKHIGLLIIVLFVTKSYSQTIPNFDWNIVGGGSNTDVLADMAIDNTGNSIVVGSFWGTCQFDSTVQASRTSNGLTDIYVAKYNTSGVLQWVNTIGSTGSDDARAVKVDAQGNIYLVADFTDSIDYDPNSSSNPIFYTTPGLTNVIVIEYSANGNLIFAKQLSGTSSVKVVDMTLTGNSIILSGTFFGTADLDPSAAFDTLTYVTNGPCSFQTPCTPDIFLAKYDLSGNHIWAKSFGGIYNDNPRNVECDANGNIYLSGTFNNTCDFNLNNTTPFILTSNGTTDAFVAKYKSNGDFIWARQLGSNATMNINDLKFDQLGNYYITGGFQGNTDFDWGTDTSFVFSTIGTNNIYIAKYDSTDNFIWVKNMAHLNAPGQDFGNSIAFDLQNNIYLTGKFYGQNCDFDPSNNTQFLSSIASNNDELFIAKYTQNGNYIWAYSIGESASEEGICVRSSNDNSLYLASKFSSSNVDFDFTTGSSIVNSVGSSDFAITKYTNCFVNNAVVQNGNTLTAFANNVLYQWVNCTIGYTAISGANSQSFTPNISGNYACIITSGACIDTTNCFAIDVCSNFNVNVTVTNNTLTAALSNATYQWLDCNNQNSAIIGATSQQFTPTVNGSYACLISNNQCNDTSDCKQITNIGFEEFSESNSIILFPNPSDNLVELRNNSSFTFNVIHIYDAYGKLVFNQQQNLSSFLKVDISNLSAGIYSVNLFNSTNNKMVRKKLSVY